jgi:hypothetical protein
MELVASVVSRLLELYNRGEFIPKQEADIQSLVYHLVLAQRVALTQIHANLPIETEGREHIHPDLVIGDHRDIRQCDILEFKFVQNEAHLGRYQEGVRIRTAIGDLRRLSGIRCRGKYLVFFNSLRALSPARRRRLKESAGQDTTIIILERRGEQLVQGSLV